MILTDKYYKSIINLLVKKYKDEFNNALPGHCIKISGFPQLHLSELLGRLKNDFPLIKSFILSDSNKSDNYITATKLIEYRNLELFPIIVIIPVNNRTAAEDSFGNATFKEINLSGLDNEYLNELKSSIPSDASYLFQPLTQFLDELSITQLIYFIIAWKEDGFQKSSFGQHLPYLGLIPDKILATDQFKIKSRLDFNKKCTNIIADFNKSIYDRVNELPLEKGTIQSKVVEFLKKKSESRTKQALVEAILLEGEDLNFSEWPIPELNDRDIKLTVNEIKSTDLSLKEGSFFLTPKSNKSSKVKIRISTIPDLKVFQELSYFRVILMSANAGSGEYVQELKRIKNTPVKQAYKDLNITLDPTVVSEGAYFIKVIAENEYGVQLNKDDDFRDDNIQRQWLTIKRENIHATKESVNAKLTCDSEDFYFSTDDSIDSGESIERERRDKVDNALQAYFKFRTYLLRNGEPLIEPIIEEGSGVWINQPRQSRNPIFHLRYNSKNDFQINFSGKLHLIEQLLLENNRDLGSVNAILSNNPLQLEFNSRKFESSNLLNAIAPEELLSSRQKLFECISQSAPNNTGVFATTSAISILPLALNYLDQFKKWTSSLIDKTKVINPENNQELKELNDLFLEIQKLDTVTLETRLEDNQPLKVQLISPLHPLRISWFVNLIQLFNEWEDKTVKTTEYKKDWYNNLDKLFLGTLTPENNPLVLQEIGSSKSYQYSGEISYGWGIYIQPSDDVNSANTLTSVTRQIKTYISSLLNIENEFRIDTEVNQKLVSKHLRNYIIQHPYTDTIVINLFNAGDANAFSNALLELESDKTLNHLKYEIRLFKGMDNIISHGEALKNLLNPEYNISEHAEAFTQPSENRLFPKLRFSINSIKEFLTNPSNFSSNISFIISPFPSKTELYKPNHPLNSFYLNGLITNPVVDVNERGTEIEWNKYINPNTSENIYANLSISLFGVYQYFIASSLANKVTEAIPSTRLILRDTDKVLINNIHDYSDWVITFDKNLGPEVYDLPGKDGDTPFLLDYVPGEEITGVSSYLTTRPTSEIIGLLGPHFKEYNIPFDYESENASLKMLLEDLRAISSSLIMQLNSTRNKAFEVIGTAFTKRVLEKKGILKNSFLIPIDLHQNLFSGLSIEDKSRADNLLITIDVDKRIISFTVIEIKCRKQLIESEHSNLKEKMLEQMDNTIYAIRIHFDPTYYGHYDRLDRQLKNKEFKSLLEFYIKRALRYEHLERDYAQAYIHFLQELDNGFEFQFKKLGIIYDFSSSTRQRKEVPSSDLTFFTFGSNAIKDILDPESDLNTQRMERLDDEVDFVQYFGGQHKVSDFLLKFTQQQNTTQTSSSSLLYKIPIEKDHTSDKVEDPLFENKTVEIIEDKSDDSLVTEYIAPEIDILIGDTAMSSQFGIIGKTIQSKVIAIDVNKTNTISLFGVQGGGKSYTIGTITELMLKNFSNVNYIPSPLAGVIFHFSETVDYAPEATSMIYPNDKQEELELLRKIYGAEPDKLDDVILLAPFDKIEERKRQYPSISVQPIAFNSKELKVQDWMFLLGAVGNDATYVRQLKAIMRDNRENLSLNILRTNIEDSVLLTNAQRALALQRLNFAAQFIDDSYTLMNNLRPGRLLIVDMRDEFIEKDEALGLFVIMLNIFSGVKEFEGKPFNKFIVFDEAHKYMNNKDLTENIVTAIREMRHKGVSILIASQDPPSLPNEIIELSSIVMLHKFNSPQWLKHIQKSITQLGSLNPADLSSLRPGEAFVWATKSTDAFIMNKPLKIITRPRVTKHGGATIEAI